MSRMLRRPPAARVHLIPQQGPLTASVPTRNLAPAGDLETPARDLGRQTFGAIRSPKNQDGPSSTTQIGRSVTWQDRVQVNPAHEQPKLIFYSGAQPLIRWGLMRRFTRVHMTVSPRFQGRWMYVGFILRRYTERPRITGVATRQGATYVQPRLYTGPGPRAVRLGG